MNTENIINALKKEDNATIVALWNEYCQLNNYYDDEVYLMDDFDELMTERTKEEGALWLTMRVHFGDFNPCHNFFYFDGYGNLRSFEYLDESDIDLESIAEAIAAGDIDCGYKEEEQ